jgi:glyoxylate/hydroxypyruvate reductase A
MAVLFHSPTHDIPLWRQRLRDALPGVTVHTDEDVVAADIRLAVAWAPPSGYFARFPRLGCVYSTGAGVEHLLQAGVPPGVAVARVVDPGMAEAMTQYCIFHIIRAHRGFDMVRENQARHLWRVPSQPRAGDRQVGILGLGTLGTALARSLRGLGFQVLGWSRTARQVEGVTSLSGAAGLREIAARADHLVCLLPLTPETQGLLDGRLFGGMKSGATLIHTGRGAQIVMPDLLAALRAGRLREAVLDVFPVEPVPAASPLWDEPGLVITPHLASQPDPDVAAAQIAADYHRLLAGEDIANRIDRDRGY